MTSKNADASSAVPWPPLIYGGSVLVAGVLSWVSDLPFEPSNWRFGIRVAGVALILAGLGLAFDELWFLIAVPVAMFAATKLAIEREEAYLTRRFGAPYLAYKDKVRRWL